MIGHPIGRWAVVAGCTVAVVVVAIVSTIMALYAASEVREAAGKPTPIGGDWSGVLAFGVGIVIAVLILLVVLMLTGVFGGGHDPSQFGPGPHVPGGATPPSSP